MQVTEEEFTCEVYFIHHRTKWLEGQPSAPGGTLLRQDDRDESCMLIHRIEELEGIYKRGEIDESTEENSTGSGD